MQAPMFQSNWLIYVVNIRHCLYLKTVADSFIDSVVVIYTEILCSRTNDRTTNEDIAKTYKPVIFDMTRAAQVYHY